MRSATSGEPFLSGAGRIRRFGWSMTGRKVAQRRRPTTAVSRYLPAEPTQWRAEVDSRTMSRRYFTVGEVDRLVPRLERIFVQVLQLRAAMRTEEMKLERAGVRLDRRGAGAGEQPGAGPGAPGKDDVSGVLRHADRQAGRGGSAGRRGEGPGDRAWSTSWPGAASRTSCCAGSWASVRVTHYHAVDAGYRGAPAHRRGGPARAAGTGLTWASAAARPCAGPSTICCGRRGWIRDATPICCRPSDRVAQLWQDEFLAGYQMDPAADPGRTGGGRGRSRRGGGGRAALSFDVPAPPGALPRGGPRGLPAPGQAGRLRPAGRPGRVLHQAADLAGAGHPPDRRGACGRAWARAAPAA